MSAEESSARSALRQVADGSTQLIDSLKPDWRLMWPPLFRDLSGYSREKLRADAFAAATVAMVSVPQAIGFALLAGLPPAMVLGCVVVGGIIASFFFSSRHVIFGPSNSLSLLLAATFAAHHNSALGAAGMAVLLAGMIGIVQLVGGLCRFGQVTQFISRSVVIGYSAAIGMLLVFSQVHHLLGVERSGQGSLWTVPLEALYEVWLGQMNYWSAGVAAAAFLVFSLIRRLRPRWPEALIGLLLFCLLEWALDLSQFGVPTLGQNGAALAALPTFSGLPDAASELNTVRGLLVPALALALLGMLEAVSIAKSYSVKSGERIDANRELVAMGLGNIASACFSSMPGSASFARSAASFQSGARTQVTGLLSGLFVLAVVLPLAPLVNHLPIPALAVALVSVGWKLVDWDQIRTAARATGSDAVALWGTFLAALLLPLDVAIYTGVGLALFLALRKVATPTLAEYAFNDAGNLVQRSAERAREHPHIAIIHVEGELFFGAADLFQEHVRDKAEQENLRVVILRLKSARHIDATAIFALRGLLDWMRQTGRHLLISGVQPDALRVLRRTGLVAKIGEENLFPAEANPNLATKKALQRSQALLNTADPEVRIFYDRPIAASSNGA